MYKRQGKPLPLELEGQLFYYAAPTPAPANRVIGSIGPTTSNRMDPYVEELLALGLKGMLGKGKRSSQAVSYTHLRRQAHAKNCEAVF